MPNVQFAAVSVHNFYMTIKVKISDDWNFLWFLLMSNQPRCSDMCFHFLPPELLVLLMVPIVSGISTSSIHQNTNAIMRIPHEIFDCLTYQVDWQPDRLSASCHACLPFIWQDYDKATSLCHEAGNSILWPGGKMESPEPNKPYAGDGFVLAHHDFNTSKPEQNGSHFATDNFICIYFNENYCILI